MRVQFASWTWRRTVIGAAAAAVVIAGGLGATALAGNAIAAPAPSTMVAAAGDNQEQAKRSWLGVSIAQLNDRLAARLGITQTTGIVVTGVMAGSPAETAGIQQKDIVQQVNGTDVADLKALREALATVNPGDTVTLKLLRNGQSVTASVTAGETPKPVRPAKPDRPAKPVVPKAGPGFPGMGGMLPPAIKELEGIAPDQMFSHLQGGTFNFTDKDGNPVSVTMTLGTVASVDTNASTVTVTPNAGGANVTYIVGADTVIRGGSRDLVQFKTGDRVMVTTVNGSTTARMIAGIPEPRKAQEGGNGNGKQHRQRFEIVPRLEGGAGPMGGAMMIMPDVLERVRERLDMIRPWHDGGMNRDVIEAQIS